MTRKSIGDDAGFMWKDKEIVYVVSYINSNVSRSEKLLTAFNNVEAAKRFYAHCIKRYTKVQLDTCRVYDTYSARKLSEGMETTSSALK